jgi:NADH-quinone oxidoreductase subunit H
MWTLIFYLPFLLGFVVIAVYAERKTAAFIQNRLGPMEVGPVGLFQTIADLLKMLQKEDVRATAVDKGPFLFAPLFIFMVIFGGFALLPLTTDVAGAVVSPGLFVLLAIISLDVLGILMAGWASNNKYSLFGAMRAAAQIISYEIPLGLSVLAVVMISQTLDLHEMSMGQGILTENPIYLFGIRSWGIDVTNAGGFLGWNVIQAPILLIVFVIFFIAGLAESNRTPFDLPEGESEIIGGYHTEYSGFRWGLFMLSEYGMMLLLSFLGSILFFGGWNTPFPNMGGLMLAEWTTGPVWGVIWLVSKALFIIFLQFWVRWTFPRLRVDQLMSLSWKYLTPIALICVLICGIWRLLMVLP